MTRRGVTIVEMLVVVAVAAVLTSILIVSLRGALGAATDTKNLANLRLTMVDFHAWSNDHDDNLPNVGLPGDPAGDWYWGDPASAVGGYLSQSISWPRVLERWRGGWQQHWHSVRGPWIPDDVPQTGDDPSPWHSRFGYSTTLLTRAEAWVFPGLRFTSIDEFAPYYKIVRFSEIANPAAKGVLAHTERPATPIRWQVAFADGRVALLDPATAHTPAASPMGEPQNRGRPVFQTLNGYRGVDFP